MENNITWITILQLLFATFNSNCIEIRSKNIFAICHFGVRGYAACIFLSENRQKQRKNHIKYITILQLLFSSFHSDFIEMRSKNIFPCCHSKIKNTQHEFLWSENCPNQFRNKITCERTKDDNFTYRREILAPWIHVVFLGQH